MAGGGERSAPVVDAARGRIRQRGMGETMQRLTAVLLVLLARQGRHGVRRIDSGDHRHPRSETVALEMQQSFWRRVTRWRGRRRRGGARDHVGEVGQWLWVRGYGSASMEASAMAGERARRGVGGANGVSARSGRRPGDDPRGATATRAMQRGWVVRGELGRAMLTSLPALARGSSWLARASTVLGRLGWAGRSR